MAQNFYAAFVYAKNKQIKVLTLEEADVKGKELMAFGWKHTATIDPCMFIEHLHNRSENINGDVMELSKV